MVPAVSLSTEVRCCNPWSPLWYLTELGPGYLHLSGTGKPSTPGVCGQFWAEEKDHLPWPAGSAFPSASHWTKVVGARTHCLLMSSFLSSRTPGGYLPNCFPFGHLPTHPPPQVYWSLTLFFPRCGSLHFPWLEFMRFLFAHFSSVLRSIRMTAESILWQFKMTNRKVERCSAHFPCLFVTEA